MDIFAAALPGCPRLGAKHMRALIEAFGTAEDGWKASDKEIGTDSLRFGRKWSDGGFRRRAGDRQRCA